MLVPFLASVSVLVGTSIVVCSGSASPPRDVVRMDSHHSFAELLGRANDFDLVNSTFIKIGSRYHHWVDASKYSPEERVVMLVWQGSAIIDNGGFDYLFSDNFDGDPTYQLTADAHKTAGLTRSYEAFQKAFAVFPDRTVPEDPGERLRVYSSASEDRRDQLSEEVWKDGWDKLREKKLAQFIREHSQYFSRLDTK